MSTITVDFTATDGRIKALNGVNNGPISFGGMLNNSHRFRELGVPWARPRSKPIPVKWTRSLTMIRTAMTTIC